MYYSAISHMIHERTPPVSQNVYLTLFSCFGVKKVGVLPSVTWFSEELCPFRVVIFESFDPLRLLRTLPGMRMDPFTRASKSPVNPGVTYTSK